MLEGLYTKIIQSTSKTFLTFCFSFMLGAALLSYSSSVSWSLPVYISCYVVAFLTIVAWRQRGYRVALLSLLFFLLGALRVLWSLPGHTPFDLPYYEGKTVELQGFVSDEPDARVDKTYYTFTAVRLMDKANPKSVRGKLIIKNKIHPEFHYADWLSVTCQLAAPENLPDSTFRYDKYLARKGVSLVCNNPKIQTAAPLPLSWNERIATGAMSKILWLKSSVQNQLNRLWAEPDSSFLAGVLYGSRSGLPLELSDNFSKTGVSHIIAVSGYNVTIIATTLVTILIALGLYRRSATLLAAGLIVLFVIFTGASASVVRAGIMGLLVIGAEQLGRRSQIGYVLVFTATLMTLFNPYVLLWDAGFQLSFLATLGLVYISPLLEKWCEDLSPAPSLSDPSGAVHSQGKRGEIASSLFKGRVGWGQLAVLKAIKQPLLTTLSAIIATLPLILFQFGRLSVVAPLVNILILWIIPWLMLGGFVTLIVSLLFFPLGQLLAIVTHFGLQYVILIVTWFGRQPWAAVEFHIPWWGMVVMYVGLCYLVVRASKSNK